MRITLAASALLALGLLAPSLAGAAEGMWTLDNLPRAKLKAQYGFEPDAQWVEHVMKGSVRLAGGCSGSFVSPEGLVLTNDHCVIGCVQDLSSAEKDYVNGGFVARTRGEELQCPGVELNRLEQTSDVTARIAKATAGLVGQAYVEARNAEKGRIESECVGQTAATTRCDVVELYNGGLHHLYRYHRYQDVRLVFAPEYASGFFGGDPDNFNFPRYNLDMALLRAYENGAPAKVDHHFPIKRAGAKPGELTLVTGHPGSTERQLTVAQLERQRDVDLVNTLLYYAERRGMLAQYGRSSAEAGRQVQNDLTSTENSYKVFRGQLEALLDPAVFTRKRAEEEELRRAAASTAPWEAVAAAQQAWRQLEAPYLMLEARRGFYSKHFQIARHLVRAAEERGKPNDQRYTEYQDASLPRLQQTLFSKAPIYAEYEIAKLGWSLAKLRESLGADDPLARLVLRNQSPEALAAELVKGTKLGDVAERKRLWDGGAAAIAASDDPFIRLARAVDGVSRELRKRYESEVEGIESKSAEAIAKVRFEKFGTGVYPDATFTLRLSYGEVKGWDEKGKAVAPFTDLAGLYARATGFDPYALAPRWEKAKGKLKLSTPFNFVTTNDIIGGNSGSPVLNEKAEIVGLAFDGNIHSLGGNYWYDERLNRCVAVHSAAILEALDKVYEAGNLVKELGAR
ncbi:MAG TPA: S46 family peptidase [Solimonas sp.]|nr:S46 family peptidase [Solimonas sp.]